MRLGLGRVWGKWSMMIPIMLALFVVLSLSAPIVAASPNSSQPTVVRKLLAHNEVRIPTRHYLHGKSGPYSVAYHVWSTDLFELCGAGGNNCYAVEGTCHVGQETLVLYLPVFYHLNCRVLYNNTQQWSHGYDLDTSPYDEGNPQFGFAHGTWKTQLEGWNADGHQNIIESSDGRSDNNPPWGVTSQFTI